MTFKVLHDRIDGHVMAEHGCPAPHEEGVRGPSAPVLVVEVAADVGPAALEGLAEPGGPVLGREGGRQGLLDYCKLI